MATTFEPNDRKRGKMNTGIIITTGRRALCVGVASALAAIVAFTGVAFAGETAPTAEATASCSGGDGIITVNITDDSSETYDVIIDDEVVDEGVTDTDEGTEPLVYTGFADGVYSVVVFWNEDESDVLDTDVTVDCVADETPTTTTTPVAPGAPVAPAAEAVDGAPGFTG